MGPAVPARVFLLWSFGICSSVSAPLDAVPNQCGLLDVRGSWEYGLRCGSLGGVWEKLECCIRKVHGDRKGEILEWVSEVCILIFRCLENIRFFFFS